jgi:hypothetical protein
MELFRFIFLEHSGSACLAALLFLLGGLLALPVRKGRTPALTWLPRRLLRMIRVLLGEQPGFRRMFLVIFGFNSIAIFCYMASGIRPWVPALISLLTGYNIAAILFLAGEDMGFDTGAPVPGSLWVPGGLATGICGLAVLLIELPCFWYSIGMGIRLGREVVAGRTDYAQGLVVRGHVYVRVMIPLLLISALCEATAIRGMSARGEPGGKSPGE